MKTLDRYAFGIVAALLAGCGGSQPPIDGSGALSTRRATFPARSLRQSPRPDGGWLSARAKSAKGLVYVSDNEGNAVYIFDKQDLTHGPVGKLTDSLEEPTGLAIDSLGSLYVASYNNTVEVFPRGHTKPTVAYTEGISDPEGLAIARDTGRLYVANSGALDVTEYPKGSTTPDKTIYFNIYEGNNPFGVTVNASDELYVTALGYPEAQAYKLSSHQDRPRDLGISDITVMHGVAVDRKGDVLIGNPDTGAIDVYPPGSRRPSKTIKTRKYIQPILIALDERDGKLYVTDPPYSTGEKGKLLVFSYPQGKLVSQVEVHGDPDGVVVSPF